MPWVVCWIPLIIQKKKELSLKPNPLTVVQCSKLLKMNREVRCQQLSFISLRRLLL